MEASRESPFLTDWRYEDFFSPPPDVDMDPSIVDIEAYISTAALENHRFFEVARSSTAALAMWVSQELVMTNAFSQIVLYSASRIKNVHIRAVLCEIAYGEHGRVRRGGRAMRAHPWLLNELRESIGISPDEIVPLEPTRKFIGNLAAMAESPIQAIAAIGVGNERLIIPEYSAVKDCFSALLPRSRYTGFLNANLNEDIKHSKLCYQAASRLIAAGASREEFLRSAISSIDNRVRYFEGLHQLVA